MEIHLIWAQDKNGGIGENGKLPWYISEDLKKFKKITLGSTIIMGRKTWDSLPIKPLPKRDNIVLSSTKQAGVATYNSLDNCLNQLKKQQLQKVFIIGGRSIYKMFFHLADYLHISLIHIITDEVNEFFPISLDKIQLEFKKIDSKKLSRMVTYTYWGKK